MKTRQELWRELREDLRRRDDLESWSTRDLLLASASCALLGALAVHIAGALLS
jgi:hypothetical protein